MNKTVSKVIAAFVSVPGFLWGPRIKHDKSAVFAPGLRTWGAGRKRDLWPFKCHADAVGYFKRKKVIKNPELLD